MQDPPVRRPDVDIYDTPAIDLREHVTSAYHLLLYATEQSAQLPTDVLTAIAATNAAVGTPGAVITPDEETKFWNAYSVLYSNQLADKARRTYRYLLYALLATLLTTQIYYLAGALIVSHLTEVEDQWHSVSAAAAASLPDAAGPRQAPPAAVAPGEDWQRLRRFATSQANSHLGTALLLHFTPIEVPATLVPPGYDRDKAAFMVNYMKLRAELELILATLSGYILPLLYGALGAFAYVLRKLSDPASRYSFAHDTWSSYTFRLHIGSLGGLAVGWFVNGTQPAGGVGSLSPLALAFAAGYGSDLLFAMLDKVVGAFSVPGGVQSLTKTETMQRGGMTYSTEIQRRAELSGATPEPDQPKSPPIKLQAAE